MRRVTQDAFDALIAENIDDFGMGPAEALEEAIAALKLQSVDLGNVRTTLPEQGGRRELRAVVATRSLATALEATPVGADALCSALELLERELVGDDVEPDALQASGAWLARESKQRGELTACCSLALKLATAPSRSSCVRQPTSANATAKTRSARCFSRCRRSWYARRSCLLDSELR